MKVLHLLGLLVLGLSTNACVSIGTFSTGYVPDPLGAKGAPPGRDVFVYPFEDRRPQRMTPSSLDLYKAYIPFLPYITSDFERFEDAVRDESDELRLTSSTGPPILGTMKPAPPYDQYEYPRSMARAVAEDLRATGLFEHVTYVEEKVEAPTVHRYDLRGVLLATPLERRYSSYCLGVAGVLLWFLPLPVEKVSAKVELDLALIDPASGASVWTYSITADVSRVVTLYHRSLAYGPNGAMSLNIPMVGDVQGVDPDSLFSWHFAALRQGMNAARLDLARSLPTWTP